MATDTKAKKDTKHPKTEKLPKKEDARVTTAKAAERNRTIPDVGFEVKLSLPGYHASAKTTVAAVTLGNPTNMAKVIQALRDELELYF